MGFLDKLFSDDKGDQTARSKRPVEDPIFEARLRKAHQAIRGVEEPAHGPLTRDDVEALRRDPELAEVAEVAEEVVRD